MSNKVAPSVSNAPRARADVTVENGRLEARAAVAAGRVADGMDVEIGSVGLELQSNAIVAQGALHRLSYKRGNHTFSSEAFSFKVNTGNMAMNADGSFGWNRGLQATFVGAEWTRHAAGGNSLTLGWSEGMGAEASLGLRDRDNDGKVEVCARASASFVTVGFCVEVPIRP